VTFVFARHNQDLQDIVEVCSLSTNAKVVEHDISFGVAKFSTVAFQLQGFLYRIQILILTISRVLLTFHAVLVAYIGVTRLALQTEYVNRRPCILA
jgi:hypothetical protein